jgi:hypothetical protein
MNIKDNAWNSKAKSFYPHENQPQSMAYNLHNRNYGKIKNSNVYEYQQNYFQN